MLKPKISRYEAFSKEDLTTRLNRWFGMFLVGIGAGTPREALYHIYDEVNDSAWVRGYNQAIKDMEEKQPKLPETS